MPSGACVIKYEGARGVVVEDEVPRRRRAPGNETIGSRARRCHPEAGRAVLRDRLVRVEQKGYRKPKPLTFEDYARTWFEQGEKSARVEAEDDHRLPER